MATTKPDTGYRSITVPCDHQQGSFIVERLHGSRIAVRIGKLVLFFSSSEASQVASAIAELVGPSNQPTERL